MSHQFSSAIRYILRRLTPRFSLKAVACLALMPVIASALCAQAQEPQIQKAPPNPAFVKWQENRRQEAQRAGQAIQPPALSEQGDSRFGYIPEPFLFPRIDRPATQIEAMVKTGLASFPASFDLRAQTPNILSPVRNQNPFGTCWAFAAHASLESNIRKTAGMSFDLSEWHLAWFAYNPLNNLPAFTKGETKFGEDSTFDLGGNSTRAIAIMARGTGPVAEASAPYQNNRYYPQSALPNGAEPTVASIRNAYTFTTTDPDTIKGLVTTNGAVAVALYWPDTNESSYYNSVSRAFRDKQQIDNISDAKTNHLVNIVGWDDNFPRTGFPMGNQPESNGAWIVRNSWGPAWGEGGYFYMSYDSTYGWIASYVGEPNAGGKIYQYDLLGKLASLGNGNSTAWFSNIFTATAAETITDVAFYTSVTNATYEITIRAGVTGGPDTGVRAFGPQEGILELPGYHRIKLATPVNVSNGDRFAVIVKLAEPGNGYPVGVMYPYEGYSDSATAIPGAGWISLNGTTWFDAKQSLRDMDNIVVCLKAFATSAPSNPIHVSVSPSAATLPIGGSQTFSATVTGGSGNTNVTWRASAGTITPQGVFTAPGTPQTVTVTATSVEDATKMGTATVTVEMAGVEIVGPPKALITGETETFSANVVGLDNKSVTWTASAGTIDAQGRFTAPGVAQTVTITATSVQVPALMAQVQVKISGAGFDGNSKTSPQLLDLANAIGSTAQADLDKYDLNGDGRIDDEDLRILFKGMGW